MMTNPMPLSGGICEKECLKRLQSTGGGPQTHDGKVVGPFWLDRGFLGTGSGFGLFRGRFL